MPSSQSAAHHAPRTPAPSSSGARLVGRGAEHHRDRVAAAVAQRPDARGTSQDSPASSRPAPWVRPSGARPRRRAAGRASVTQAGTPRRRGPRGRGDQGALKPQTLTSPPLAGPGSARPARKSTAPSSARRSAAGGAGPRPGRWAAGVERARARASPRSPAMSRDGRVDGEVATAQEGGRPRARAPGAGPSPRAGSGGWCSGTVGRAGDRRVRGVLVVAADQRRRRRTPAIRTTAAAATSQVSGPRRRRSPGVSPGRRGSASVRVRVGGVGALAHGVLQESGDPRAGPPVAGRRPGRRRAAGRAARGRRVVGLVGLVGHRLSSSLDSSCPAPAPVFRSSSRSFSAGPVQPDARGVRR